MNARLAVPARYIFSAGCLALLAACASMDSKRTDVPEDGLAYYLPKKDFIVTVVREPDKPVAVTIEASAAYPDVAHPYVLNFKRNWIGRNEINVGIGANGLLTSAKSTTTSGIGDVLKNLAATIGTLKGKAAPPTEAGKCPLGTFTHVYEPDKPIASEDQPCGLTVTIMRAPSANVPSDPPTPGAQQPRPRVTETQGTGVFYRQEVPYLVQVKGGAGANTVNTAAIRYSPSASTTRFLPIESTLFASNQADFGFVDGMPTKYDQNADGEVIGLLKLPADVVGAYFEAVGKVFAGFKSTSGAEGEALAADTQLQLAKMKYDACIKAIQAKDDELISSLECGK